MSDVEVSPYATAVEAADAETARREGVAMHLAAHLYALLDAAVILAPALVVRATGARDGMGDWYSIDLVAASAVIAVAHGTIAGRRMLAEEVHARRQLDVWIAGLDALVVLALSSTLLITGVLFAFANQHAWLANRGAPVVLLWAGVQGVAILLAEVTGRGVYRWLEDAAREEPAGRRLRRRPRPPA